MTHLHHSELISSRKWFGYQNLFYYSIFIFLLLFRPSNMFVIVIGRPRVFTLPVDI